MEDSLRLSRKRIAAKTPRPLRLATTQAIARAVIADICAHSNDVGFLPDFLGKKARLHPVSWQSDPSKYRILALFHRFDVAFQKRLNLLVEICQMAFADA